MKKKYVASFLSFCMILSTVGSTTLASETTDLSVVSDASVMEEELQYEIEGTDEEYITEENSDEEVIQNDDFANNSIQEEYVIDNDENDDYSSAISKYNESDNYSNAISEYDESDGVKEGYTRLTETDGSNIQYKYDEDSKTLHFELIDKNGSKQMPNLTKLTSAKPSASWIGAKGSFAKNAVCIEIGEGIESIGDYNFQPTSTNYYANVKEVILPSSVKKIGKGAFQAYNCTGNYQKINLNNVQEIGEFAFYNSGIAEADLSNATTIGNYAFSYCSQIGKITLNQEDVKIGNNAFDGCGNLTTLTAKTIDSIGDKAFTGTEALKKIELNGIESLGQDVFLGSGLQQLLVSFNEEKIGNINAESLGSCASLKNICYAGTTEQWKNKKITLKDGVVLHCKNDIAPVHATCETAGQKILTCEICGGEYTDGTVAPALGHEYAEDYTVDKEATCTEVGSESKHCTRCDEIEVGSEKEIPALGHDYVAEITTQPTCTKDGVRTLTCSRCKDVKTEVIPATGVHQWSDWKKTADATVFTAEQQERNCATCDKKETRTVGDKLAATATVSASSVTLKEKQSTGTVKVTGLANGDSVTSWKSTNTKVFTVSGKADGTCKLTGVKKGDAKLEITLASGLKKTVSVKVQAKTVTTSKISGLAKKMTVKKGEKATLKPVITPATSQQKVTYSSSNKSVATVSSKGVIIAKKAGTAKITVKSGSKKVTVTVTVPKTKTTAIKVGEKVSVKKGKTYSLKAKTTPSNSDEKITYKTSNKKIATVSKSGKIKGVKKGTATITIKSGKIVKKVKVTVK